MVYWSVRLFALVLFTGNCKAVFEDTPVQEVFEAKEGRVLIDNDGLVANDSTQKELRQDNDIAHKISFMLTPVPQITFYNETYPDKDNNSDNVGDQSRIDNVPIDVQPKNSTVNDAGLATSNEIDSNIEYIQLTTEVWRLDTEEPDKIDSQKADLQNEAERIDQSKTKRLHLNNDSNSEEYDSMIPEDDYAEYNGKKDSYKPVDILKNENTDEITLFEDSKQISDTSDVDKNLKKPTKAYEYNESNDYDFGSKESSNENAIEPSLTGNDEDFYEYTGVDLEETNQDADISDEDYKDDDNTDIDDDIKSIKHTDYDSSSAGKDILNDEDLDSSMTEFEENKEYSTLDEVTLNRTMYAVTMFLSVCLIAMGLFLFWNRHRVGKYIMRLKGERPYTLASARPSDEEKNLLANEFA